MVSLTAQYKWYHAGSLKIQLLVLGCIWLISWILFHTNLRSLLYLFVAVYFVSNSILQFTDRDGTQTPPSLDQTDNMLVTLIGSREPVITPNIYLLVYDSYIVNETMLAYGIDNLDQEQYLKGLTYSVASSSTDSMSRVLNSSMSYYGNERRAVSGDGIVQNLLEEFGYKTYGVFPMDFFFRGVVPSYDYSFPSYDDSFLDYGSSVSLLYRAIFMGEMRFDNNFDEIPSEEEPRFVYTHSKMPGHSTNSGVCRPNEIELFSERLALANVEMRQDISLLIENDPEAIVIVASDHGPHLTKNCYGTGDEYDISEITRLDIQDRNGRI